MFSDLRRVVHSSIALALLALGVQLGAQAPQAPATAPAAPAQPPAPTPVQLANQAELRRIMDQLKISGIPPGAVSANIATYDEATANPYPTLPDPLTLKNGQKVTTAAMWKSRRRPELIEEFQREIYGRTPKTPKVMSTTV